jgi:predicted extracellular nuclease
MVISQVFGGGGNAGSTYKNDFVELLNRGTSTVDLSTWSVQYGSATGSSWTVTPLTGTVAAGHYYLVQEAAGGGGTPALPTPDATGTLNFGGTAGKVALSKSGSALTGACPTTDANLVDVVGYGAANCMMGSANAPTLSATTSATRAGSGCTDTPDNGADFAAATPAPRNTSSTKKTCACP